MLARRAAPDHMLSMHMEQFGSTFIPFREVNSSAWPGKLLRLQSGGCTTAGPVHVDATAASSPSGSECASSSHSSLQGPSRSVLQHLCPPGREVGAQLLVALQVARDALSHAQRQPCSDAARRAAADKLQDVHMCIVQLDYELDEHHAAAASGAAAATLTDGSDFGEGPRLSEHRPQSALDAEDATVARECRAWLQHAQAHVLHVLRQVDTLRADGCEGEEEWRELFAEAHDDLSRMAERMGAGNALDVNPICPGVAQQQQHRQGVATAGRRRIGSRLVCPTSRLSYKGYWSKAIAI